MYSKPILLAWLENVRFPEKLESSCHPGNERFMEWCSIIQFSETDKNDDQEFNTCLGFFPFFLLSEFESRKYRPIY